MTSANEIILIYDKECPLCRNYSQMVRLRQSVGKVTLISAREDNEIVNEVAAQGYDLNEGIVLKVGNNIFYGADAMHKIALMGGSSGIFNRLNYWTFRSRGFSRTIYPALKAGRRLLLTLLGRKQISSRT